MAKCQNVHLSICNFKIVGINKGANEHILQLCIFNQRSINDSHKSILNGHKHKTFFLLFFTEVAGNKKNFSKWVRLRGRSVSIYMYTFYIIFTNFRKYQ